MSEIMMHLVIESTVIRRTEGHILNNAYVFINRLHQLKS